MDDSILEWAKSGKNVFATVMAKYDSIKDQLPVEQQQQMDAELSKAQKELENSINELGKIKI